MKYQQTTLGLMLFVFTLLSSVGACAQNNTPTFYVAKYKSDKLCAISYTFDDGLVEHYTSVYPKFEKLGFKGTFWVNGNTINRSENGLETKKPRTTWLQLQEMAKAGHEVSNHGWSHKNLKRCTPEERRIEIERNDSILTVKLGEKPATYCYAFNAKNDEVIKEASAGRVGTRTKQFSMGRKSTSDKLDAKLEKLRQEKDWGVAMIHGISYGYDAFSDEAILWKHLAKVKEQEDEIWVATFCQVAAYTKEQQHITFNTHNKRNGMVLLPKLNLDKRLFNEPLTMVIKTNGKLPHVKQGGKQLPVSMKADKALFDFSPNGGKIKVTFKTTR